MTFKALAIADVHMSNRLPHAKPSNNDRTDRLDDQLELWKHVKDTAEEEQVDAIIVLGDLFDRSMVDAVTLTHTVQAIVDLDREIYILPGNHDANSIRGGRFTVEAFGAMRHGHIHVMGEKPGHRLEVGNWTFWPVAFAPAESAMASIEMIKRESGEMEGRHVLLLHASIMGAHHMGWECDDGLDQDEICEGFDYVYAGHFHESQEFGSCGMYLGAPMHHHFGDAGRDARFWIWTFEDDGTHTAGYVDGGLPHFHVMKSLKAKLDGVHKGDYVRYELETTHPRWAKLKPKAQALCEALKSKGIKADFKHKPVYQHESRLAKAGKMGKAISMESAIEEYIKAGTVKTVGLDGKRLKELGLEALAEARSAHGFD